MSCRPRERNDHRRLLSRRSFAPDLRVWQHTLRWSPDRILISVPAGEGTTYGLSGKTYVVPLAAGQAFPPIPAGGFRSEAEIAKLPGAAVIDAYDVAAGPTRDVYAYSRQTVQRNLYRIPIP